jgi:hypothetical protein
MATDLREKPATAAEPGLTPAAEQRASAWIAEQATKYPDLNYLIGQFEARQNEIALQTGKINHDIYEPRLGTPNFTDVPRCMFFFYLRVDTDGKLTVDHYFYVDGDKNDPETWQEIPYYAKDLNDLVQRLAVNARPLRKGDSRVRDPEREAAHNFQGPDWTRRSYVAIFLDEANWKFHKFPDLDSAVVFITEEKNGKKGTENHSFFDAIDLPIEMPIAGGPAKDTRSAIVFINHMKGDEAGADLGDGVREFFQFKMFVDVTFASGPGVPMTVIFDPDGTNLGPPLQP